MCSFAADTIYSLLLLRNVVVVVQNSILYVMNNYRFPKWYYGYESGATKSQREMKHYLRAYVMRLPKAHTTSHPNTSFLLRDASHCATVVASHASPSFTLISYRRASESRRRKHPKAGEVDPSDPPDDSSTESEREENRENTLKVPPVQAQAFSETSHHDDNLTGGILLGLRYGDLGDSSAVVSDPSPMDPLRVDPAEPPAEVERQIPRDVEEKMFWQQGAFSDTMDKGRQLSILQYFITHLSVDCGAFWSHVSNFEYILRRHWTTHLLQQQTFESTRSRRLLSRFSLPAFANTDSLRSQWEHHQYGMASSHHDRHILALCAEIAVEVLTSKPLNVLLTTALATDSSAMSSKSEQRERFAVLVDSVYDLLSQYLRQRKNHVTLLDLVDEIVTLVYRDERFRWMQVTIGELMRSTIPESTAFEAFCAQSREVYMTQHERRGRSQSTPSSLQNLRCGGEQHINERFRGWNGRWLLSSKTMRVRSTIHQEQWIRGKVMDWKQQFMTWELLSTIQQLASVDISLDTTSGSLCIGSAFASSLDFGSRGDASRSRPTRLVLDRRYRIFRAFPNGVSTLAVPRDGWVYGDYVGFLENPYSIKIWFYAFAKQTRTSAGHSGGSIPARRISVHVGLNDSGFSWQADPDIQMDASVRIDHGIYSAPAHAVDAADLLLLSSRERQMICESLDWTPSVEFECDYQQI